MTALLLAAILAQAGDAALTCDALRTGRFREVNPVFGQSCARVVAIKSVSLAGIALVPNRKVKIVLSAYALGHGAAGFAITLSRR